MDLWIGDYEEEKRRPWRTLADVMGTTGAPRWDGIECAGRCDGEEEETQKKRCEGIPFWEKNLTTRSGAPGKKGDFFFDLWEKE